MALPSSGTLSIQDIVDEFGGTAPHSLSEYYRGGAYVPSSNTGVPTSGTISLSDFYGASAATVVTVTEGSYAGASSFYGFANNGKLYDPVYDGTSAVGVIGSRTPTTLNGATIDCILYIANTKTPAYYFEVGLRGTRSLSFFTSVTPQGGSTLNTSSATRVVRTSGGSTSTYWYWSTSSGTPSGWNGSGTRTASFVV